MRKYLAGLAALGLCASVWAGGNSVSSSVSSSVNSESSSSVSSTVIQSHGGSSVSNSVNTGGTSSAITHSIVGSRGSMCSAELHGKRCDIQCQAPQVATCGQSPLTSELSCLCK